MYLAGPAPLSRVVLGNLAYQPGHSPEASSYLTGSQDPGQCTAIIPCAADFLTTDFSASHIHQPEHRLMMPPSPSGFLLDWTLQVETGNWKLETNGQSTSKHIFYLSGSSARDRRVRVEETWTRNSLYRNGVHAPGGPTTLYVKTLHSCRDEAGNFAGA